MQTSGARIIGKCGKEKTVSIWNEREGEGGTDGRMERGRESGGRGEERKREGGREGRNEGRWAREREKREIRKSHHFPCNLIGENIPKCGYFMAIRYPPCHSSVPRICVVFMVIENRRIGKKQKIFECEE